MKYFELFLHVMVVLFIGVTLLWIAGSIVAFADRRIVDPTLKFLYYVTATGCVGVWVGVWAGFKYQKQK